jgi:hypothetical protein
MIRDIAMLILRMFKASLKMLGIIAMHGTNFQKHINRYYGRR